MYVFICIKSGKVRSDYKWSLELRAVHLWSDHPGPMLIPNVNSLFFYTVCMVEVFQSNISILQWQHSVLTVCHLWLCFQWCLKELWMTEPSAHQKVQSHSTWYWKIHEFTFFLRVRCSDWYINVCVLGLRTCLTPCYQGGADLCHFSVVTFNLNPNCLSVLVLVIQVSTSM